MHAISSAKREKETQEKKKPQIWVWLSEEMEHIAKERDRV